MYRSAIARLTALTLLLCSTLAGALDAGSLLGMLTSQHGVSEAQATGGAGALMDVAKQNLTATDYTRLIGGAPDLAGLGGGEADEAQDTPAQSGGSWGSMVKSASTFMGGENKTLQQASQLAEKFDQLGLTPDMVGKFAKTTLDYVNQTGGSELMGLLKGALPL